jgi:Pyridoxamine 5'-phosphate oxidase
VKRGSGVGNLTATASKTEAMANGADGVSRYLALTTYRRDGRPVTTPVWAVALDGRIYVFTATSTGKAKRVRATGRVRFAPCSMNGRRILGEWREGTGRVVAADTREQEPDRPRKRGPKRGPNPPSKTVPTGHTASHRARGTRRNETPGPARDFDVWRAKEMVDRGRIELQTPGFSVPVPCLSQRDDSRVEGETRERWVRPHFPGRGSHLRRTRAARRSSAQSTSCAPGGGPSPGRWLPPYDASPIAFTASGFSSDETSPAGLPRYVARITRRMILALRVFGRSRVNSSFSGFSALPIAWATR